MYWYKYTLIYIRMFTFAYMMYAWYRKKMLLLLVHLTFTLYWCDGMHGIFP